MEQEEYLTVIEAARLIGVTESAIRNATLEGRLDSTRKYNRKLIRRADVMAYQERTQPNGEPLRHRPRADGAPSTDAAPEPLTGSTEGANL